MSIQKLPRTSMIPRELFHYTSADTALKHILFNQEIRIGQFKYTNDPRESKDWSLLPNFIGIPKSSSLHEQFRINQELTRIKQDEWKVICFSTHAPKHKPNPYIHEEGDLSHGACKPRMWASYAANHKGVCLKFNGKEFDNRIKANKEKNRKVFSGKVKYKDYDDNLETVSINYNELYEKEEKIVLRHHLVKNYKKFFLLKSVDWGTENEYRWLIHGEKEIYETLEIKGVIEEVILGADFHEAFIPSIQKLCKNLDIPVRKLRWINGYPYITTEQLK